MEIKNIGFEHKGLLLFLNNKVKFLNEIVHINQFFYNI